MTDSKNSHWKSLAADLTGNTDASPPVEELSNASAKSEADEFSVNRSEGDSVPQNSIVDGPGEDAQNSNTEDAIEPIEKKKKRGSWAFWRSGNKKKKASEASAPAKNTPVVDDPLALLNQAETTDDMACAIDQLFASNGSDSLDDDVVFDADEIATSIDFEDDTRAKSNQGSSDKSREGDQSRTRSRRNSRRRRGEEPRERSEKRDNDRSARSRNDRENSRNRRSERRDRDNESGESRRRQVKRRKKKVDRPAIDHGEVPTWDTAVSFVVDNNMVAREGKSGRKKNSGSRTKTQSRR
jgi:hypothetical protein